MEEMEVELNKPLVTEEDRLFYEENGYWISPKLIDDDRIERLIRAMERVWAGDFDGDGFPLTEWVSNGDPLQLRKVDNAWWINDEIRDMVTDSILGEIAAGLLGTDEVRLWYDQIIHKPGVGANGTSAAGNVGWHQDYVYWQCTNTTNLVTAWIALQDTDLTNGCMMVVPGSHKWQLDPRSYGFHETDLNAQKERYSQGRDWREEPVILKAGQASFHHALLFHGSGPNLTDQPRRSVVAHLMPKGTAYKKKQNVDNIRLLGPRPREGQLFANEYFPVLYAKN
jgi:ectoine hydroxylase-related dioxygenase (phytanoyl-CoA dioxygenase family)